MTITQQQLILEEIVNRCDPHRVTIDKEYAVNVGWIRVIDDETLLATRSLHFEFHPDRFDFQVDSTTQLASHRYGKPRSETHAFWVKSTPVEVIDAVVTYLTGRKT